MLKSHAETASMPPDEQSLHSQRYRPDIDGLRAIAVVSVILFHMVPNRFVAGGIGVDLFFVISGYLIGGHVLQSTADNRFSFGDFYIRRARRILPALLVMMLATALIGFGPLYPWELTALSDSILMATACVSNFYFWFTSDYFAPDSATLPMLHTWSLGVEEQFYFVFPFLPLLLRGVGGHRWITAVLVGTAALSLWFSVHQVITAPSAAFYLLPSRWWELMAGVLATRVPDLWMRSTVVRTVCAAVGLALILASLALVVPANGFPGLVVLPACLGMMLLLATGQAEASIVHRLLGVMPLRVTGLISYSLYLWHWPVIVLYRTDHLIGKLALRDCLVVLTLTAVTGFVSWRFVEQPFRRRSFSARALLVSVAALTVAVVALQLLIIGGDGFPSRIPPKALALAKSVDAASPFPMPRYKCVLTSAEPFSNFDDTHCLGKVAGKPDWLLVGDSHAAMLRIGLEEKIPEINLQVAADYGCDIHLQPAIDSSAPCDQLMRHVLYDHPRTAPPAVVLLSWRWQRLDEPGLAALAASLRGHGSQLVIVGPTPGYTIAVSRILAEELRRNDPTLSARLIEPRLVGDDARLSAIAARLGVPYLSPLRVMCSENRCLVRDTTNRLLYGDSNHYTGPGSAFLIGKLRTDPGQTGQNLRSLIERTAPQKSVSSVGP